MIKLSVYLTLLLSLLFCIDPSSARCPDIGTVHDFDIEKVWLACDCDHDFDENLLFKFMGKWYEIEKYPSAFQSGQSCITNTYQLKDNGLINVTNEGIFTLQVHSLLCLHCHLDEI